MTTRHAARTPARTPARAPARAPASTSARTSARTPAPRTVSRTSADRFASRVRGRRRRRVLIVAVALVLLTGGGWLAWRSPWATVRTVELHRVPAPAIAGVAATRIPDAQLTAPARGEIGHPMLIARIGDVRAGLRRLPLVRSVEVHRVWPSKLVITVAERQPVAAVPAGAGGGFDLVDRDGMAVDTVAAAPAALPRLDVDLQQAGSASLRACLAMLRQLPADPARRIATIGADSPDGIRLTLKDGAEVRWGDASRTPRKAEVLTALLKQKAVAYDVSSPDTPTVRPR